MRLVALALLVPLALLAGCKRDAVRPTRDADAPSRPAAAERPRGAAPAAADRDGAPAAPPDLSGVREPTPRPEPRAVYGNKSPYTVLGRTYHVLPSSKGYVERGIASWYGTKFHGRLTSSREPYDMFAVTAAHKTLPLPTYVRVTNLDNGRTLVVRVNDRGPFHDGRIIDLSYAAAVKLGVAATGTARVEVRALDPGRADLGTLIAAPPPRRAPRSAGGEASGPAPRALAPPARAPRSSGRPVYLQVGSFADRDNARRLEDRLEDADVDDVFLDRARVGGRTVHRVRIGPFERLADAQALVARLRGLGYSGVITAAE